MSGQVPQEVVVLDRNHNIYGVFDTSDEAMTWAVETFGQAPGWRILPVWSPRSLIKTSGQ